MNKNITLLLAGIALSFSSCFIFAQAANALDENETVEGTVTLDDYETASDSTAPVSADSETITSGDNTTEAEVDENAIENGLSGEAEVVCADPNEPGCSEAEVTKDETEIDAENDVDPETWPMIISLSALGAAILFVILFNLFGRKKK